MPAFEITIFLAIILLGIGNARHPGCSSNPSCSCNYLNSTHGIQADCSFLDLTESPIFYANVTSVILNHNRLRHVPNESQLPKDIVYLDLSRNEISNFTNVPFLDLYHLLSLDLSSNHISLNNETYFDDLFKDLKSLVYLNIGFNDVLLLNGYPEIAFSKLSALETLIIDISKNQTFGLQFSAMNRLQNLKFSYCLLELIDQHTFDNLPFLKNIQITKCKSGQYFVLKTVEAGAFSKLKFLEFLDVSGNRQLGFCALRNITKDLRHTAIKVLKATHLHCPYGQSTVLFIDDIKPLYKTNLSELYIDSNNLEMTEMWAPSFLPVSLRILGISDNRWYLQSYAHKGIQNLTSLSRIDLRSQDMSQTKDLNEYMLCDDFYRTSECLGQRMKIDKQRWYENEPSNCKKNATPLVNFTVTTCEFNESICPHVWVTFIPPNTNIIQFDKSELGDTIHPNFMSDDVLKNLSLSENNLKSWIGPICNVTNLKYLDLSMNKCSFVTEYFFVGLTGIETLKLKENDLGLVLSENDRIEIFKNQAELKFLDLSANKMRRLSSNILKGLHNLRYLDLSNNLLQQWDASISHMDKLSYIDLSQNQIVYLSDQSMKYINQHHINKAIDLSKNNFKCVCDSLAFLEWIVNNVSIYFINHENYTCTSDDMKIYSVTGAIAMLSKKCPLNYGLIIGIALLSFSIALCTSILIYRYRWKIMYFRYVVQLKGPKKGYELLHERKYDAFISYADADGGFVYNDLLERLENGQNRTLKLCIHKRDFIPGTAVADNIANAIHNSSRTICVVSDSFLRSHWCNFEFNIALTEGVVSRRNENIIILLLLEKIPKKNIPLNMLAIMDHTNYFDLSENAHLDEKWELLLAVIPNQREDVIR